MASGASKRNQQAPTGNVFASNAASLEQKCDSIFLVSSVEPVFLFKLFFLALHCTSCVGMASTIYLASQMLDLQDGLGLKAGVGWHEVSAKSISQCHRTS